MRQSPPKEPSVVVHTETDPGIGPEDLALLVGVAESKKRMTLNRAGLLVDPITDPDARRIAAESNEKSSTKWGILLMLLIASAILGVGVLAFRAGHSVPTAPTPPVATIPVVPTVTAEPTIPPVEPVAPVETVAPTTAEVAPLAVSTAAKAPSASGTKPKTTTATAPKPHDDVPPLRLNLDGLPGQK